MQLTTVGQEVWRGGKQAQKLAEAGAGDPTVQERLIMVFPSGSTRKLKLAQFLHQRKADWAEIQELVGISRATYHRWAKELLLWPESRPLSVPCGPNTERQRGLRGLNPKSKVLREANRYWPKRFRERFSGPLSS